MTTPSTADVINRVKRPFPFILQFLAELNKQANVSFAETPFIYRTTTGRVNYKPFIIGFIPPDDPIDFVPIARQFQKPTIPYDESQTKGRRSKRRTGLGNKGSSLRFKEVSVCADVLRDKVRKAIIKQTGRAPSERTLALVNVHIWAENANEAVMGPGKSGCFPTRNYNLGQSHVGGEGRFREFTSEPVFTDRVLVTYSDGTVQREKDVVRIADFRGAEGVKKIFALLRYNNWNWNLFIDPDNQPGTFNEQTNKRVPPSTSSYLAIDTDEGVPYPVYFGAFESLDQAVAYQVGLLASQWPRALEAQTPEEYVDALQRDEKYAAYFDESIEERYTGKLDRLLDIYKDRFGLPDEYSGDTATLMSYGAGTNFEDPLAEQLGRNIELANADRLRVVAAQTDAIKKQIELIKAMPPLILLINPREFRRSHEQSVDFGVKGRHGHIVHTWLERPMKISGSGVSAAQYAMTVDGGGGLTGSNRIYSLSYQNLMSMAMIYKNNGLLFGGYDGDDGKGSDRGIPILAMSVFIYYDGHMYIGSFDDMSIGDDATKPYNMSYSFRFNVRYDMPIDGVNLDLDLTVNENLETLGF